MTRRCREIMPQWRRRSAAPVLHRARLVTDPKKLAQLKAEAERIRFSGLSATPPVYHEQ
jgi:hypothetical protein